MSSRRAAQRSLSRLNRRKIQNLPQKANKQQCQICGNKFFRGRAGGAGILFDADVCLFSYHLLYGEERAACHEKKVPRGMKIEVMDIVLEDVGS